MSSVDPAELDRLIKEFQQMEGVKDWRSFAESGVTRTIQGMNMRVSSKSVMGRAGMVEHLYLHASVKGAAAVVRIADPAEIEDQEVKSLVDFFLRRVDAAKKIQGSAEDIESSLRSLLEQKLKSMVGEKRP